MERSRRTRTQGLLYGRPVQRIKLISELRLCIEKAIVAYFKVSFVTQLESMSKETSGGPRFKTQYLLNISQLCLETRTK